MGGAMKTGPTGAALAMDGSDATFRWMIRADFDRVMEIERQCFGEFAWSREDLFNAVSAEDVTGHVIERGGDIVGFVLVAMGEYHRTILNLAVDPLCQRQGLARWVVEREKDKVQSHVRRRYLEAAVWERNVGAQQFFRACGFRCVRTFENAWECSDDAAYVFRWNQSQGGE